MILSEIFSFVFGLMALAAVGVIIYMAIAGANKKKDRRGAMEDIASSMATQLGVTGADDKKKAICLADKFDDTAKTTDQKIANLGGACMAASFMSKMDPTYKVPSACSDYSTLTEDQITGIITGCGVVPSIPPKLKPLVNKLFPGLTPGGIMPGPVIPSSSLGPK
jgi:hypothetical protein